MTAEMKMKCLYIFIESTTTAAKSLLNKQADVILAPDRQAMEKTDVTFFPFHLWHLNNTKTIFSCMGSRINFKASTLQIHV